MNYVRNFLYEKPMNKKSENISIPMSQFYSQTLEALSRFFIEISKVAEQPFETLKRCMSKIENETNELELSTIRKARYKLVIDLRVIVLCNLSHVNYFEKRLLQKYHSVLHIISILAKPNNDMYLMINDWINTNWLLQDDDVIFHAFRGNFGKLIMNYPHLQECIEYLSAMEDRYRKGEIKSFEYDEKRNEWIKRYKQDLPVQIRDILVGEQSIDALHWRELLCYRLAYNKLPRHTTENEVFQVANFLTFVGELNGSDEAFYLLTNNTRRLQDITKNAWLKLVISLVHSYNRIDIYDAIVSIAQETLITDWQVALDYFSYTVFADHYFTKVCMSKKMNPVIFDFLERYSKRNNLNFDGMIHNYAKLLQKNNEYEQLARIVYTHELHDFKYGPVFIRYLLDNFDRYENVVTASFRNSELGKFITAYNTVIVKRKIDTSGMCLIFNCKYTMKMLVKIIDDLTKNKFPSEQLIIKCLEYLLTYQKELVLPGQDIHNYKKLLVDKLHATTVQGMFSYT